MTAYIKNAGRKQVASTYEQKICLNDQLAFTEHRSGWAYALDSLTPLHNPTGVRFHGVLERWLTYEVRSVDLIKEEFSTPWCAFLHGAIEHPKWFSYINSLTGVLGTKHWEAAVPTCKGIFVLSNTAADFLRTKLPSGVPVSPLVHPTEIADLQFTWEAFVDNPVKSVVQLGWYLRKLESIYRLPTATYRKIHLIGGSEHGKSALGREQRMNRINRNLPPYFNNTKAVGFIDNDSYDRILSKNIGFLELYASNANNAVIECIARATPVLVNKLPSVEEYLGKDYPLYFDDLYHAARLLNDIGALKAAHQYLKQCDTRSKLSQEHFLETFAKSEVYASL